MIFNAGSKYSTGTGGTYGSITLSGNGTFNVSAATTGPYAGIVFFQPVDNTKAITVTANAAGLSGTIYAPSAQLAESGNAAVAASLIVDALSISSNGAVGASIAASGVPADGSVTAAAGATAVPTGPIDAPEVLGQTTPISVPINLKIKVTDSSGNNVSLSSVPVVSMSVVGSDGNLVPQTAAASSQPGNPFAFDATTGTYQFNLKLKGYKPGF